MASALDTINGIGPKSKEALLKKFKSVKKIKEAEIEDDIQAEFEEALIGIKLLPISSRFGVYLAYKYYFSLFKKIKRSSATKVLNERVRIPDSYKLLLMSRCYLDYKISSFI